MHILEIIGWFKTISMKDEHTLRTAFRTYRATDIEDY